MAEFYRKKKKVCQLCAGKEVNYKDVDTIKKAINTINRRLTYENYVSLNELYSEIGLDSVKNGDLIGWNLDQGLIEPTFDTCLAENDEPCVVIDYYVAPRYDFDKLM